MSSGFIRFGFRSNVRFGENSSTSVSLHKEGRQVSRLWTLNTDQMGHMSLESVTALIGSGRVKTFPGPEWGKPLKASA